MTVTYTHEVAKARLGGFSRLLFKWKGSVYKLFYNTVHGADERGRLIRRSLIRYLNLMQVLTYRSISTAVFKRFPTEQHVIDAGFMTKAEHKIITEVETNNLKYWIPACWFSTLLSKTRQEGRILDDITYNKILEELNTFRGCCGMLLSYDWISVPLVYTQVVTVGVYMYFATSLLGSQYLDPEMHYDNNTFDLYIPIVTIGQFFFYMGWLKVAEQLINPFGEDDDDFEANFLIDRNLELSLLAVDQLYMKHPKLERDLWWNLKRPEVPYTAASMSYRVDPFMGSTFDMSLSKEAAKVVEPKDNLDANDLESTILTLEVPLVKQAPTAPNKSGLRSFANKFKKKLNVSSIPLTQIKEESRAASNERLLVTEENNESSNASTSSDSSDEDNDCGGEDENKNHSHSSSLSSITEENDLQTQTTSLQQSKPSSSDDLSGSIARKKVRTDAPVVEPNGNKRRTKKRTRRGRIMSSEGETEKEMRNAVMRVRPELKAKKKKKFGTRQDVFGTRPNFFTHQFPSDIAGESPSSPKPLRWAYKSKNRTLFDDMVSLTASEQSDDQNDLMFSNRNLMNSNRSSSIKSNASMPFTTDLRHRLQVRTSPFPPQPMIATSSTIPSTTTVSLNPQPDKITKNVIPFQQNIEVPKPSLPVSESLIAQNNADSLLKVEEKSRCDKDSNQGDLVNIEGVPLNKISGNTPQIPFQQNIEVPKPSLPDSESLIAKNNADSLLKVEEKSRCDKDSNQGDLVNVEGVPLNKISCNTPQIVGDSVNNPIIKSPQMLGKRDVGDETETNDK